MFSSLPRHRDRRNSHEPFAPGEVTSGLWLLITALRSGQGHLVAPASPVPRFPERSTTATASDTFLRCQETHAPRFSSHQLKKSGILAEGSGSGGERCTQASTQFHCRPVSSTHAALHDKQISIGHGVQGECQLLKPILEYSLRDREQHFRSLISWLHK